MTTLTDLINAAQDVVDAEDMCRMSGGNVWSKADRYEAIDVLRQRILEFKAVQRAAVKKADCHDLH